MLTVVTQIPGPFLGWARTATCTCLSKLGRRLISLAWQFQTVSVPIIENGHGSVRNSGKAIRREAEKLIRAQWPWL